MDKKIRKNLSLRIVAFFTATVFLYSTVSASFAEASLWQERRNALKAAQQDSAQTNDLAGALQMASLPSGASNSQFFSAPAWQAAALNPQNTKVEDARYLSGELLEKISVHADLAQSYFVEGQTAANLTRLSDVKFPLVIQLGDMHGVYSFQKNLEQTILTLNQLGLQQLYVEGASQPIDFIDRYAQDPRRQAVKNAAQFFLQGGYFTGSESAGLVQENADLKLIGLEDQALYQEQIETFKRTIAGDKTTKNWLKKTDVQMQMLERKIFSAELQKFWQNKRRFDAGQLGLNEWTAELSRLSAQNSKSAPNFTLFLKAAAIEKTLNAQKVQNQQTTLLKTLAENLPRAQWNDFLRLVLSYRMGKTSAADFTRAVQTLAARLNVKIEDELNTYFNYSQLTEQIRAESLFEELTNIESQVLADQVRLSNSQDVARLAELAKDFSLLEKALDFKFNPAEWQEFNARKSELQKFSTRLKLLGAGSSMPDQTAFALQSALRFGELSAAREEVFARKIMHALKKQNVVAMVAGGYHSQGVERILRDNKISHITLRAKTDAKDLVNPHHPLEGFIRAPRALETLFQPERVSLVPPLTSASSAGLQQQFERLVARYGNLQKQADGTFISADRQLVVVPQGTSFKAESEIIEEQVSFNGDRALLLAQPLDFVGASHQFVTFAGLESFTYDVLQLLVSYLQGNNSEVSLNSRHSLFAVFSRFLSSAQAQQLQQDVNDLVSKNLPLEKTLNRIIDFLQVAKIGANSQEVTVLSATINIVMNIVGNLTGPSKQDRPSQTLQDLVIALHQTLMGVFVPVLPGDKQTKLQRLADLRDALVAQAKDVSGKPVTSEGFRYNSNRLILNVDGSRIIFQITASKTGVFDNQNRVRMSYQRQEDGRWLVLVPQDLATPEGMVFAREEIQEILAIDKALSEGKTKEQAIQVAREIDANYRQAEDPELAAEFARQQALTPNLPENWFEFILAKDAALANSWAQYQKTNYARAAWIAAGAARLVQPNAWVSGIDSVLSRLEVELRAQAGGSALNRVSYQIAAALSMVSGVMVSVTSPRAAAGLAIGKIHEVLFEVVKGLKTEIAQRTDLTAQEIEVLSLWISRFEKLQLGLSAVSSALYPEMTLAKVLAFWASQGRSETERNIAFMVADILARAVLPTWRYQSEQAADLDLLRQKFDEVDRIQKNYPAASQGALQLPDQTPSSVQMQKDAETLAAFAAQARQFEAKYGWTPVTVQEVDRNAFPRAIGFDSPSTKQTPQEVSVLYPSSSETAMDRFFGGVDHFATAILLMPLMGPLAFATQVSAFPIERRAVTGYQNAANKVRLNPVSVTGVSATQFILSNRGVSAEGTSSDTVDQASRINYLTNLGDSTSLTNAATIIAKIANRAKTNINDQSFTALPALIYDVTGATALNSTQNLETASAMLNALLNYAENGAGTQRATYIGYAKNLADTMITQLQITTDGSTKGLFKEVSSSDALNVSSQLKAAVAFGNLGNSLGVTDGAKYSAIANDLAAWVTGAGQTSITANSPLSFNPDGSVAAMVSGIDASGNSVTTMVAEDLILTLLVAGSAFSSSQQKAIADFLIANYEVTKTTVNGKTVKGIRFLSGNGTSDALSFENTANFIVALRLLGGDYSTIAQEYETGILAAFPVSSPIVTTDPYLPGAVSGDTTINILGKNYYGFPTGNAAAQMAFVNALANVNSYATHLQFTAKTTTTQDQTTTVTTTITTIEPTASTSETTTSETTTSATTTTKTTTVVTTTPEATTEETTTIKTVTTTTAPTTTTSRSTTVESTTTITTTTTTPSQKTTTSATTSTTETSTTITTPSTITTTTTKTTSPTTTTTTTTTPSSEPTTIVTTTPAPASTTTTSQAITTSSSLPQPEENASSSAKTIAAVVVSLVASIIVGLMIWAVNNSRNRRNARINVGSGDNIELTVAEDSVEMTHRPKGGWTAESVIDAAPVQVGEVLYERRGEDPKSQALYSTVEASEASKDPVYIPSAQQENSETIYTSVDASIYQGNILYRRWAAPALESLLLGGLFSALAGLHLILMQVFAADILQDWWFAGVALYGVLAYVIWVPGFAALHGKRARDVKRPAAMMYVLGISFAGITALISYFVAVPSLYAVLLTVLSFNIGHYIAHQYNNLKQSDWRKAAYQNLGTVQHQELSAKLLENPGQDAAYNLGFAYALTLLTDADDKTRAQAEDQIMRQLKTHLNDSTLSVSWAQVNVRQLAGLEKSEGQTVLKSSKSQFNVDQAGQDFVAGMAKALFMTQLTWRTQEAKTVVAADQAAVQVFDLSAMDRSELVINRLKNILSSHKANQAPIVLVSNVHNRDQIRAAVNVDNFDALVNSGQIIIKPMAVLDAQAILSEIPNYSKLQVRTDDAARWASSLTQNSAIEIIQILVNGIEMQMYSVQKIQNMIEGARLIQTQA